MRPRKACRYPNLRSFGWVSYDKVGVLYSGKLGNRSEARASDLRRYPGLWWNRIKQRFYEGKESEYSPRTCSIGRPAGGTLCPPYNLTYATLDATIVRDAIAGLLDTADILYAFLSISPSFPFMFPLSSVPALISGKRYFPKRCHRSPRVNMRKAISLACVDSAFSAGFSEVRFPFSVLHFRFSVFKVFARLLRLAW